MTTSEWQQFEDFRAAFKQQCMQWLSDCGYGYSAPEELQTSVEKRKNEPLQTNRTAEPLHRLQQKAAEQDGTPFYPVETPIVYNHSLDTLTRADTVKLIIISDNPGKNEQLHRNQRYLVGQAGKVAENFFRRTPALQIDFRTEVVILNKTPLHTAKTKQLGFLLKNSDEAFAAVYSRMQEWMAQHTATLQQALGCEMWLVGYGELRKKSLFAAYAEELKKHYAGIQNAPVYVFQHFSMNCFSNDLKKSYNDAQTAGENLRRIGLNHRRSILGW